MLKSILLFCSFFLSFFSVVHAQQFTVADYEAAANDFVQYIITHQKLVDLPDWYEGEHIDNVRASISTLKASIALDAPETTVIISSPNALDHMNKLVVFYYLFQNTNQEQEYGLFVSFDTTQNNLIIDGLRLLVIDNLPTKTNQLNPATMQLPAIPPPPEH